MEGQCLSQGYFGCKEEKPVSSEKRWETVKDKTGNLVDLTDIQAPCILELAGQEGWLFSPSLVDLSVCPPFRLGLPPPGPVAILSATLAPSSHKFFTKYLFTCVSVPPPCFYVLTGRLQTGSYCLQEAKEAAVCQGVMLLTQQSRRGVQGARPGLGAVRHGMCKEHL